MSFEKLMDRINYQAKDHLHNQQPLRSVDNTDIEKDSLREEVKALRRRVKDLEKELGREQECQHCGDMADELFAVSDCDPSVGYHSTLQVCGACAHSRTKSRFARRCGSCGV